MKDKKEIRREVISIRENIDIDIKNKNDKLICERLFCDEDFINSKEIFIYLSYNNEVNTYGIIKTSFELCKKVAVPKTVFKDRAMDFINLNNFNEIDKIPINKIGIKEPLEGEVLYPKETTLVIVPGVAFTLKGERIGYGGGFYDKYLIKYNIKNKIALCYEFQILEEIPVNEEDILVSKIITEDRSISL
ncbi:MAG: 5-formyltetrahydrofolate cyclo-ligase [Oscillospiraceae bacterium]|nr:5-formyltetrahydrofolate cyclo-ligase [Oscillospiraceae bacterium]